MRRTLTTAIVCLASMSSTTLAETATVTYVLDDVWLLPDVSHPGWAARQMFGVIEWTYEVGDFEDGAGEFIELSLPWWGEGLPPLAWTIEASSLEITMPGKYHDHGVDVTLRFLKPLAPDRPSTIDTVLSAFEIQVGVSRMGHAVSGDIVPVLDCPTDLDGDGSVGFADLTGLLSDWGACAGCVSDLDGDEHVGFADLTGLLAAWGACA